MASLLDEPTIGAAEIGPGHDGRPEVIVTVVYSNGASAQLSLEQEVVEQIIARSHITDLAQLAGQPCSILFPAIAASETPTTDSNSKPSPSHPIEEPSPCST